MSAPAITHFIRADGRVELSRILGELRITKPQLAASAGLSKDTIAKKGRLESGKSQARLRDFVEIMARVATWAGSFEQAFAWYRAQPIPSFGDRTAEDLVRAGQADLVKSYIARIAAGGYA